MFRASDLVSDNKVPIPCLHACGHMSPPHSDLLLMMQMAHLQTVIM
jgi:hypothetical protein